MIKTYGEIRQTLSSKGFDIMSCGSRCPVEIDGYLPNGLPFHFRARGHSVSLDIWFSDFGEYPDILPDDEDLLYSDGFVFSPVNGHDAPPFLDPAEFNDFWAGWMEADGAYWLLLTLLGDARDLGALS